MNHVYPIDDSQPCLELYSISCCVLIVETLVWSNSLLDRLIFCNIQYKIKTYCVEMVGQMLMVVIACGNAHKHS